MVRYGDRKFITHKRKYLVAVTHPTAQLKNYFPMPDAQSPMPNAQFPILNCKLLKRRVFDSKKSQNTTD